MEKPHKVNLLESDLDKSYFNKVLPRLDQIPNFKEIFFPLTRLYDENFWTTVRSVERFFIARTDYRHWLYEDSVFEKYVEKIVSTNSPAIVLFDPPYETQPSSLNILDFEKKLFERTKYFAKMIRSHCPGTTILSPPICLVDELEDRYLEYFVHNRTLFDVYALNCCHDFEDSSNARLFAFLNQILEVLHKPVWITQWAVPSCDHPISNALSLGPISWKPVGHAEAVKRMRDLYRSVNQICNDKTTWFYTGLGKDDYNPDGRVSDLWTGYSKKSDIWDFMHFTGLLAFNGSVKEQMLDSLLEISENESR